MKKIYILITLIAVLAISCKEDFIDLAPLDQNSPVTFYQTEPQFRLAVTAAYVPLRNLMEVDYFTAEIRSDNTHYELAVSRSLVNVDREKVSDFTDEPTNTILDQVYVSCYSGISKANIVIERLSEADVPAAAKADIDGQAKFLRAFFYFKLVRYFGGVPLFLKEVKKADEAFLTRSTVDEVYNQIVADAKDAINQLAAPAKFPQSGHVTKGSATMLLAEIYMTQKKYAEAEALLNTLPAMGYSLNANYSDAFSITNKNSKESLFEIQYLGGISASSQPSNFIYRMIPRSINTTLITGILTNNSGNAGWNIPTKDLISKYEANDKRLDASIGIAEGTYNSSGFMVFSANKSIINYTPAPGKVGVPYTKKYLHPHTAANNTDDNWPIYRYSDALLLLAEAMNEQGKTPQALIPLNTVRTRAGLPASTQTNQALLQDIIANERRVELAFENHRWHDLVRTGKAAAVMNAHGIQLKQQNPNLTPDSYNVTPNKLIYPFPQAEINLNPALTQNPGY